LTDPCFIHDVKSESSLDNQRVGHYASHVGRLIDAESSTVPHIGEGGNDILLHSGVGIIDRKLKDPVDQTDSMYRVEVNKTSDS